VTITCNKQGNPTAFGQGDKPMTESERQAVGLELASWLHAILAGVAGSAARFVEDASAVAISPRWDAPHALTLEIRARGHDVGRIIGRRRGVSDPLAALAQRLGERLGLLIRIQVSEAG
jgi:predicted RNA-binding protein YlqC (UPF0109 family)